MTNEPKDTSLYVTVTRSDAQAIDDWRYSRRIPSRAEAIRRLMRIGLQGEATLLDLLRLMKNLPQDDSLKSQIAKLRSTLGLSE